VEVYDASEGRLGCSREEEAGMEPLLCGWELEEDE